MNMMPEDPTAYRPMKVTASKDTQIGFELEPIRKKVTLDKMRLFRPFEDNREWWPQFKGWHTDYAVAQEYGFPKPIVEGPHLVEYMGELLTKFFGKGIYGGTLSITFLRIVECDEEITVRGVVKDKIEEDGGIRLNLEVWCENQRGEKVVAGNASGVVL